MDTSLHMQDLNNIYEFRRIGLENLSDMVGLVENVSRKSQSLERYRKKYLTPWSEGQFHGWLAYERSSMKAVSVAAALPLFARFPDGRELPITQMTETFTLPEHRGKGLMTAMVGTIINEQIALGTHLFFGLLNQNNVHGFIEKLGFTHIGKMNHHTIKIKTFPLEALCRRCKIPALFQWWANKITSPLLLTSGEPLNNSAQEEGYGGVLHDNRFFSYKSFTYNKRCRIAGIDCWLKFETGLLVGDALIPENCPEVKFDDWLACLIGLARRAGLHQIIFQSHPSSRLGQKLSARIQDQPSWSVCVLADGDDIQSIQDKLRFCYGDFETF